VKGRFVGNRKVPATVETHHEPKREEKQGVAGALGHVASQSSFIRRRRGVDDAFAVRINLILGSKIAEVESRFAEVPNVHLRNLPKIRDALDALNKKMNTLSPAVAESLEAIAGCINVGDVIQAKREHSRLAGSTSTLPHPQTDASLPARQKLKTAACHSDAGDLVRCSVWKEHKDWLGGLRHLIKILSFLKN